MQKQYNNLQLAKKMSQLVKKSYKKCINADVIVKDKSKQDLLTNIDTSIERCLIKYLKQEFGDVKIVSEEYNSKIKAEGTYFTIDPIDGTVNFANGIGSWGIQCGYVQNNEALASVIYLPKSKEMFYAAKGYGSFKNGTRFFAEIKKPQYSIINIELKNIELQNELYSLLGEKILKFRQFGAASVHSVLTAEGKMGGFIVGPLHEWDLVPGFLIMEEAGCCRKTINNINVFATCNETLDILFNAVNKIIK